MRSLRRALALPSAAAALVLVSAPASAQSFFEKLFGIGAAAPRSVQAPPARPSALRGPAGDLSRFDRRRAPGDDDDDDGGGRRHSSDDGSGKVRTVCVRLCDGFYWPVSNAISPRNMSRDAGKCRASCGEEAVLYHEPAPGGDVERMVDGGGRPYTELRNAFLYRKTRVEGCACKPEPWSEAALDRHRQYAAIEAERRAKLAARMRPVYVAADMTPPSGGMASQPMQVASAGPSPYPGDATPGEAAPLTIAALAATPAPAEEAVVSGTADVVAGSSGAAPLPLEPALAAKPEPPAEQPKPVEPPAPLFTAEPAIPSQGSGPPVVVAEAQPVPPPPAASPAAIVPEPDDPIVAPRREPVADAPSVVKSITEASPASAPEPKHEVRPQLPDHRQRQPARSRREASPEPRKPAHKTAHAERPRQQPQRQAKVAAAAPSLFGKPKFTYPGDAPARYR